MATAALLLLAFILLFVGAVFLRVGLALWFARPEEIAEIDRFQRRKPVTGIAYDARRGMLIPQSKLPGSLLDRLLTP